MVGKFFLIGVLVVLGAVAISNVLTNPANEFAIYEHLIDSELTQLPDGAYSKTLVVISRDGLTEPTQTRLQEVYSKSPVKIQFVADATALTPAYLAKLAQTQNISVRGFSFKSVNYREGVPTLDYTYLNEAGSSQNYTAQLSFVNGNQWQIVQRILSTL